MKMTTEERAEFVTVIESIAREIVNPTLVQQLTNRALAAVVQDESLKAFIRAETERLVRNQVSTLVGVRVAATLVRALQDDGVPGGWACPCGTRSFTADEIAQGWHVRDDGSEHGEQCGPIEAAF